MVIHASSVLSGPRGSGNESVTLYSHCTVPLNPGPGVKRTWFPTTVHTPSAGSATWVTIARVEWGIPDPEVVRQDAHEDRLTDNGVAVIVHGHGDVIRLGHDDGHRCGCRLCPGGVLHRVVEARRAIEVGIRPESDNTRCRVNRRHLSPGHTHRRCAISVHAHCGWVDQRIPRQVVGQHRWQQVGRRAILHDGVAVRQRAGRIVDRQDRTVTVAKSPGRQGLLGCPSTSRMQ